MGWYTMSITQSPSRQSRARGCLLGAQGVQVEVVAKERASEVLEIILVLPCSYSYSYGYYLLLQAMISWSTYSPGS